MASTARPVVSGPLTSSSRLSTRASRRKIRTETMKLEIFRRTAPVVAMAAVLMLAAPDRAVAQGRGGGGPPRNAKDVAPVDLTGYWVALITEDWRYRMMTPAPGDFPNVPVTAEGRKIALAWDPAKD